MRQLQKTYAAHVNGRVNKTKELFKVSYPTSDVVDKFYIKEYEVH